jgi:hypothetical protein
LGFKITTYLKKAGELAELSNPNVDREAEYNYLIQEVEKINNKGKRFGFDRNSSTSMAEILKDK